MAEIVVHGVVVGKQADASVFDYVPVVQKDWGHLQAGTFRYLFIPRNQLKDGDDDESSVSSFSDSDDSEHRAEREMKEKLKKEAEGNENSEGGSLAWNVNLNRVAVENGVDISGLRIRHQMSTDAMLLYIHVENLKQEASFVEDETLGDAILNPGHKYSQSIL